MNILKDILTLGSFFLAGVLFVWLKGKITNKVKSTIKQKIGINASIGNVYKQNGEEVFNWKKFLTGFGGLTNSVGWAKDIVGLFNVRKITIFLFIFGIVGGFFYWKGQQNVPIKIDIGYGKEAKIDLNGEYLHIDKEGNVYLRDTKTNQIIKQISVKDIPDLKKKLAPYGFQCKPIAYLGYGFGDEGAEGEGGAGLSWLRYYKYRIQSLITNRGWYPLALGYKITDNSGLTLGIGKGWDMNDERVTFGYHFEF